MQTLDSERRRAFSQWLRTGRVPGDVEQKFNPWHDPRNGRFTFAQSGQRYGLSGGDIPSFRFDPRPARAGTPPYWSGSTTSTLSYSARKNETPGTRSPSRPNRATEFIVGVGEGITATAKETAKAVYSAATTNPVTTIREAGRGIAQRIDAAIAAEETPARIQISRSAHAIRNASARDIGRAVGSTATNVAVGAVPGTTIAKVATVRRLRAMPIRPNHPPVRPTWVNENLDPTKHWTAYNNGAPGARPGQAPALKRTMPDGSKRPVKFDGIQGDYVVDRKWTVTGHPKAVAQLLRQSQALREAKAIGLWEVRNQKMKQKAIKLMRKHGVTNIHVKVVKP